MERFAFSILFIAIVVYSSIFVFVDQWRCICSEKAWIVRIFPNLSVMVSNPWFSIFLTSSNPPITIGPFKLPKKSLDDYLEQVVDRILAGKIELIFLSCHFSYQDIKMVLMIVLPMIHLICVWFFFWLLMVRFNDGRSKRYAYNDLSRKIFRCMHFNLLSP